MASNDDDRKQQIIDVLADAFSDLMDYDPDAFRVKYRKMAADPYAFYRGTAPLFYRDVSEREDPWADERAAQVWVHGDLHAENFGSYLNSDGILVFDVNDFDEAYVGHYTWDLMRFVTSMALIGWRKALPQDDVRALIAAYLNAYLDQVEKYADASDDTQFALTLDNTEGPILELLQSARRSTRAGMLDGMTSVEGDVRRFLETDYMRRLDDDERSKVEEAFIGYLDSIPEDKRMKRDLFYRVRDVVRVSGFGIGSAGLPAYNVLIEGYSQALDNDVLLSMKQAIVPAMSRFVDHDKVESYFDHEGHRTVESQRALQVHADPLLGHTTLDGVGYMVSELSPYEIDLEWDDIYEPSEIEPVVQALGRATAKVHCSADEDSEQTLVDFQVEDAVLESIGDRREDFVSDLTDFGMEYAERVRQDHFLFVEAFRGGDIGIDAT